ncbi:unnamed protein product [Caretta caretta]
MKFLVISTVCLYRVDYILQHSSMTPSQKSLPKKHLFQPSHKQLTTLLLQPSTGPVHQLEMTLRFLHAQLAARSPDQQVRYFIDKDEPDQQNG